MVGAGLWLPLIGADSATVSSANQAATVTNAADTLETQAYLNEKVGFKIRAPKGWQTTETKMFGLHVIFSNATEQTPIKKSINVVSEAVSPTDLATYVATTKKTLAQMLSGYQAIEDENLVVSGNVPAKIIGACFKHGDLAFRNAQLIVLHNDRAYLVTAVAAAADWAQVNDLFMQVFKSLEFVPTVMQAPQEEIDGDDANVEVQPIESTEKN
jgi:hypothetical protein